MRLTGQDREAGREGGRQQPAGGRFREVRGREGEAGGPEPDMASCLAGVFLEIV